MPTSKKCGLRSVWQSRRGGAAPLLSRPATQVYFGRSALGRVVHLPQMTYAEVLRRMVSLMYVEPDQECSAVDEDEPRHEDWRPEGRWIDPTYQARVYDIMRRTEALFRRAMPRAAPALLPTLSSDSQRALPHRDAVLRQRCRPPRPHCGQGRCPEAWPPVTRGAGGRVARSGPCLPHLAAAARRPSAPSCRRVCGPIPTLCHPSYEPSGCGLLPPHLPRGGQASALRPRHRW